MRSLVVSTYLKRMAVWMMLDRPVIIFTVY